MKIISHRGNVSGREISKENSPDFIIKALELFEVEIDVWYVDGTWFLGHDYPKYNVEFNFFNKKMWLHCKNIEAFEQLSKNTGLNYFWHQDDVATITSFGRPWCNIGHYISTGVTVVLDEEEEIPDCYGICTDNPQRYL